MKWNLFDLYYLEEGIVKEGNRPLFVNKIIRHEDGQVVYFWTGDKNKAFKGPYHELKDLANDGEQFRFRKV